MKQNVMLNLKVLLVLSLCMASVGGAAAQNQLAARLPDNCEGNAYRLDVVRNKSRGSGENKMTIAIARLGTGEKSRELNRRRLYTVRAYLTAMGLSSQNLVTAEGERVQGYGRIEVYIGGELVELLRVKRCKDLHVGICDNDLDDKRRYQLPRKRNAIQCR